MKIPEAKKTLLADADSTVDNIQRMFRRGFISEEERYEKVIDTWTKTTENVTNALMSSLDKFNPIFMMAHSGARGSKNQIRQLCGMRGLMANPAGKIIELPIRASFREGLNVLEYFISTHGARKGLADTALRTADSDTCEGGLCRAIGPRVLDAGCGTGENLRMLHAMLKTSYLGGFDWSPLALNYARNRVPDADLYRSDLCDPEFHAEQFDLILSCDVVCTIGLEAARQGMLRLVERIRPGGLLMVNLPAYQWLFSRHDVAVATRERFTASQIRRFLDQMGLQIELLSYRLCALFPAVVLARLPTMLLGHRDQAPHSDLSIPSSLVNRCLGQALRWENQAILRGVRFPWGSSIFAVARRR
jgi:SAM-dependent methyltransferase